MSNFKLIFAVFLMLILMSRSGGAVSLTDNCQTAYSIAERALEQIQLGQVKTGLQKLQTAVSRFCPEDALLNYNLGHAFYKSGKPGQAVYYFQKAVQKEPKNPKYLNNLAFAMLKAKDDIPAALNHAQKALKLRKTKTILGTYFELIKTSFQQDQNIVSFRRLTNLRNQYPDHTKINNQWEQMLTLLSGDGQHYVGDETLDIDSLKAIDTRLKKKYPTYALIIGISDYEKMSGPQFAVRDAKNFRKLLIRTGTLSQKPKYCRLLTNKSATIGKMYVALDWLVRQGKLNPQATMIFYFSGHGAPQISSDGKNLHGRYLLAYEVQKDVISDKTAMNLAFLEKQIQTMPNQKTLAIIDACYSGGKKSSFNQKLSARKFRKPLFTAHIPIISAAASDKAAEEYPPGKQGAFTYFFMQGMMGPADGDGDQWVDSYEAFQYAVSKLDALGKDQNPQITVRARIPLTRVTSEQSD